MVLDYKDGLSRNDLPTQSPKFVEGNQILFPVQVKVLLLVLLENEKPESQIISQFMSPKSAVHFFVEFETCLSDALKHVVAKQMKHENK